MSRTAAWYLHSIGGLLLTGMGLSLTGEAIILKSSAADAPLWIALGTLGLVVFNSGLALVGKGAVLLAELRREKRREMRRKRSSLSRDVIT